MDLLSQQPLFSTEIETKGFDLSSGNKWIYPENYPLREYQFAIAKTALFHNTLVCLPTGLGKTFIAAVVMYNFWRWYPSGLIIFLAPTKPLVAQQINACHNVMGIPLSETIELTGTTNQKQREIVWRNKRVIFATPQTFQKDLEKGIVKTELIKCVVIDEAHRALGKHSYCESIRLLHQTNRYHRVLALSATPGGKLDAVQEVIRNLHITHLELRDDASPDIVPYINDRKLDIIQVSLGANLTRYQERYIEIMDPYFRVLLKNNLLRGATSNITKGRIFHIRKEFMNRRNKPYNFGSIVKALNILLSMCHANDLLMNHGLRAFVNFYQNHSDKFWMKDEVNLMTLIDEIKEFIGPFPEIHSLMDSDTISIPDNIIFGHGKFYTLREILMKHFENAHAKNMDTRAIVFVEYRDIVNEVFVLLLQLRPLIKPQIFVGQAGLKQREQKRALNDFRSNHVNVLISTSVGEEGLDVGEVDLIICFDILQHSPIRLVQRMGRTGRKRDGHIIVLVTEGRERETLKCALAKRDSLNNKVLHSSGIIDALGEESPRMIPPHLNPECLKMFITVIPTTPKSKKQKKGVTKNVDEDDMNGNERKSMKKMKAMAKNKSSISKSIPNTMLRFLATSSIRDRISQDDDVVNMKIEEVHPIQFQSQLALNFSQRLKPSDVRLLTCDNESVEFLTLCTMKQSAQDIELETSLMKISYIPTSFVENFPNISLDFDILPYSMLNCIENLKDYIAPVLDEGTIDETNNAEICNDDHFSHSLEDSRYLDMVLANGRFEELLDDTSDSDQTVLPNDQSFIDQTNDRERETIAGSHAFQERSQDRMDSRRITNSIVIGGAFEDLLDESSDDSVPQYLENSQELSPNVGKNVLKDGIPLANTKLETQKMKQFTVINLDISEFEDSTMENSHSERESLSRSTYERDHERMKTNGTLNLHQNFESDFDSWNKSVDKYSAMGPQVVNENIDVGRMSPDLSKSSQRKPYSESSRSSNPTEQQPIVPESTVNIVDKTYFSDGDIIGVETLLFDSDIEDQVTPTKKSNTEEKNDKVENKRITCRNSTPVNSERTDDGSDSRYVNMERANMDEFVDDFDWNSSDFETLSAPITESKYFRTDSDRTSRNSKASLIPNIPEHAIGTSSETGEGENEILIANIDDNMRMRSISEKFLSKFKTNSRQNIHCDNELTLEKTGINVSGESEHSFTVGERFREELSSTTGRWSGNSSHIARPELLSTRDSIQCVMPKILIPEPKSSIRSGSLQIGVTRSSPLSAERKRKKPLRKKNRVKNAFIDDEAEVSANGTTSPSTSGDDVTDCELEHFISHSQYHDTSVDMRAHYLQSVRSPRHPGRFLIKRPMPPSPNMQIYSQAIQDEPNVYLYDSFCVGDTEPSEHSDQSLEEISILMSAERESMRQKRKHRNCSETTHAKRRRIVVNTSDDTSEDETERLRAEIANQSLKLEHKQFK